MLTPTIQFAIRDFSTGIEEECVVDNNEDNYAMIAAHRFTRNIKFGEMFSFDFAKKFHMPTFMLETLAIDMLNEYKAVESINDMRDDFAPINSDEMTGCNL